MKRMMSIAIALLMVVGVFAPLVYAAVTPSAASTVNFDPEKKQFSPEMRKQTYSGLETEGVVTAEKLAVTAEGYYEEGDAALFIAPNLDPDPEHNGLYMSWFTLRQIGQHCEVWVANNLKFASPTDPRNDRVSISDENVTYIVDQFDNVTYPIEAQYFGTPDPLNGTDSTLEDVFGLSDEDYGFRTDEDGRVMIMIMNIRDESYYNPDYRSYIVGFFSPSTEYYYDRNVIHIDCFDWANRTTGDVSRPYVYESTVAHEYQHLLHDALDSSEESFINEGCSMYAEILCGYGVPYDYINEYFASPTNSLIEWGDQGDINILADYGAAMMFMVYLKDHFGGASFISDLAHNTEVGMAGVTDTLKEAGYGSWNFDKVFANWRLANLIHDSKVGSMYNYTTFDLNSAEVNSLLIENLAGFNSWMTRSQAFGEIVNADGDGTGMYEVGSYGVDYIYVDISGIKAQKARLFFDGYNDVPALGWMIVDSPGLPGLAAGSAWYSGDGNELDQRMVATLDLTNMEDATLSFNTNMSAEAYWDYCFVQVSTDGGATWTSLENAYTNDELDVNGYPAISEQLPGLTGYYNGVMNFVLDEYVGQEIMVQFRYMSDWSATWGGWYVNNIRLNGTLIDDAGFTVSCFEPILPETDFKVTLYAPECTYHGKTLKAKFAELSLKDLTESGSRTLASFNRYAGLYIIVSPTVGPVDYNFMVYSSMRLGAWP